MAIIQFPVIDPVATGANITRLRRERGFTVRDLPLLETITVTESLGQ